MVMAIYFWFQFQFFRVGQNRVKIAIVCPSCRDKLRARTYWNEWSIGEGRDVFENLMKIDLMIEHAHVVNSNIMHVSG